MYKEVYNHRTVRGIEFKSINVLEKNGMKELNELGVRTVPVVSKGKKFIIAQIIRDVIEFLDLKDDPTPELTPKELAALYNNILEIAVDLTRQVPNARLDDELPNRPRSWRVLMHHVFQIPTAFLDDIAQFGEDVYHRFKEWWVKENTTRFSGRVQTYFGQTTRHEMLERTVWHSAQHVRQVSSLVEEVGITVDRPLTEKDIKGLPLTDKIWG